MIVEIIVIGHRETQKRLRLAFMQLHEAVGVMIVGSDISPLRIAIEQNAMRDSHEYADIQHERRLSEIAEIERRNPDIYKKHEIQPLPVFVTPKKIRLDEKPFYHHFGKKRKKKK